MTIWKWVSFSLIYTINGLRDFFSRLYSFDSLWVVFYFVKIGNCFFRKRNHSGAMEPFEQDVDNRFFFYILKVPKDNWRSMSKRILLIDGGSRRILCLRIIVLNQFLVWWQKGKNLQKRTQMVSVLKTTGTILLELFCSDDDDGTCRILGQNPTKRNNGQ